MATTLEGSNRHVAHLLKRYRRTHTAAPPSSLSSCSARTAVVLEEERLLLALREERLHVLYITVSVVRRFVQDWTRLVEGERPPAEEERTNMIWLLRRTSCLRSVVFSPEALQLLLLLSSSSSSPSSSSEKENENNNNNPFEEDYHNGRYTYHLNDFTHHPNTTTTTNTNHNKSFQIFLSCLYSHPVVSFTVSGDGERRKRKTSSTSPESSSTAAPVYQTLSQLLALVQLIAHLSGVYSFGDLAAVKAILNKDNEEEGNTMNRNNRKGSLIRLDLSGSNFTDLYKKCWSSVKEGSHTAAAALVFPLLGRVLLHPRSSLQHIALDYSYMGDALFHLIFSSAAAVGAVPPTLTRWKLDWSCLEDVSTASLLTSLITNHNDTNTSAVHLTAEGNAIVSLLPPPPTVKKGKKASVLVPSSSVSVSVNKESFHPIAHLGTLVAQSTGEALPYLRSLVSSHSGPLYNNNNNNNNNDNKREKEEHASSVFNPLAYCNTLLRVEHHPNNNNNNNNNNRFDPLLFTSVIASSSSSSAAGVRSIHNNNNNSVVDTAKDDTTPFTLFRGIQSLVEWADEYTFDLPGRDMNYHHHHHHPNGEEIVVNPTTTDSAQEGNEGEKKEEKDENNNNNQNNNNEMELQSHWVGVDGTAKLIRRKKVLLQNGKLPQFDPFYYLRNVY